MLDIFLLAVVVVGFKGVGIGSLEVRYGTYCFAFLVISSMLLTLLVDQEVGGETGKGDNG